MTTITTKFDLGDVVYKISYTQEQIKLPCRDCLGKGWLKATLASGATTQVPCPANHVTHGNAPAVVGLGGWPKWEASTGLLTIGQLQIRRTDREAPSRHNDVRADNRDPSSNYIQTSEDEEKYMCWETGVGSGSVHNSLDLFADLEEAIDEADRRTTMARAGQKIPGTNYGSWQPDRHQIAVAGAFLSHRELYEHDAGHVLLAEAIIASGDGR